MRFPCNKSGCWRTVCCSILYGPLLELSNIQSIGFHLYGDSTSGKTTALAAAASVWGSPSLILAWRSTTNGLEIQASGRSSTLIALDESHMIEAKMLDASIYLLANGVSKTRMNKDIAAREVSRWRVCVLSTGERSIESHLAAAKIDHKVGQGIRIADVPVSGQFGLFNDLHGRRTAASSLTRYGRPPRNTTGTPGPCFCQRLIDTGPPESGALAQMLSHFGKDKDGKDQDLSAQEQRVARGFALVALAGELATAGKIVPWQEGDATAAAVEIFDLWRAAQPQSARGKEHAQIIDRIAEFVDRHGNSRFLDINFAGGDLPIIRDQAGYYEDTPDGRIYLFTAGGLKAGSNFGFPRVLAAIEAAGAFTQTGAGAKARVRRVPEGGTKRLYHVDIQKLRAE